MKGGRNVGKCDIVIRHSFFHFHIGLLYRCHYAAPYVLAASNQDVVHPFSL